MTTYTQTSLKTFFETGDVPTGQNYADLIDSCLNVVDTSAQSMAGPLSVTEVIAGRVSAGNGVYTGTMRVDGIFSAGVITLDRVNVSAVTATGNISASAASVYASAGRFTEIYQGVGVVSAAGTTQGTAAVLANVINRGKGITDGATTGFTPPANRAGMVQYLYNEGASANLWPPVGGFINGLAVNTPLPLATSAMVTIIHLTASSMAVK